MVLFVIFLVTVTLFSLYNVEQQKPVVNTIFPVSATLEWSFDAKVTVRPATQAEKDLRNDRAFNWVVDLLVPFEAFSDYMEMLMSLSSEFILADRTFRAQFVYRNNHENGDTGFIFAILAHDEDGVYEGMEIALHIEHMGNTEFNNLIPFEALHYDILTGEHYVFVLNARSGAWGSEYYVTRFNTPLWIEMPRIFNYANPMAFFDGDQMIVTYCDQLLWDGMMVRLGETPDAYMPVTITSPNDTDADSSMTQQPQEPTQTPDDDGLSGTIRILTHWDSRMRRDMLDYYINSFSKAHPNVEIVFEEYIQPSNITDLAALITRLIADPPDILNFFPGAMVFEKVDLGTLFADLNEYIDGERGIDRSSLFDNILRSLETRDGLFHVPTYIQFYTMMLNKPLFESIGID